MPAFTQAIEAHQRRITQAILEHALKICSEKNVSGGGMDRSVLQFQSSPLFPISLIGDCSSMKVEVKTEVVVGDPKEKICEVAANRKADLLVMGCRAIGPLKR